MPTSPRPPPRQGRRRISVAPSSVPSIHADIHGIIRGLCQPASESYNARMILVTGGAGFIGSALHAALARRGERCIIADWLGAEGKWRNLRRHPPERIIRPE